jgi:hypothetical protein
MTAQAKLKKQRDLIKFMLQSIRAMSFGMVRQDARDWYLLFKRKIEQLDKETSVPARSKAKKKVRIRVWYVRGETQVYGPFFSKRYAAVCNQGLGGWGTRSTKIVEATETVPVVV